MAIKLTPDSSIGRIEVYDHDPIEIWFKNRVVLLGDSAHAAGPTSGQGACQAIEDAYCLAECLSNESTVEQSLETYTFLRKDKASNIIIEARKKTEIIFKTKKEECEKRNRTLKDA